jgi:SAM-dependent methyltransferase
LVSADSRDPDQVSSREDAYDAIEHIAELYDFITVYNSRGDVGFYVEEARGANGDVLEIGCGTGRVLIPAARAGVRITGLDASPRMLGRCRTRLESEPAEVRSRVVLHNGDMRSFDLNKTFTLVIVPFRPLQHLLKIDDQIAALDAIGRHLERGGRLVFDVFNPDIRRLADPTHAEEREDTPETRLPDGRTLRRTGRVTAVHTVEQYSEVELIYYVQHPDGRAERLVQSFPMRWYTKSELIHLLARVGFRVVRICGDFDRSPLSDESPEMIFIAERD